MQQAVNSTTTLVLAVLLSVFASVLGMNLVAAAGRKLRRRPRHLYGLQEADFRRVMGVLLGPSILPGNDIRPLVNGDRIFPPMLAAIRGAEHSICLETFIYWSGSIAEQFSAALEAAAARGVRVHVIFDWLGTRGRPPRLLTQLRRAGVEVVIYHALSWFHLGRMNNRTHRKLLVVDGEVGFTGGVGIAPQWEGDAEDPEHWRDTHYEVRGPVVAQMQAVFLDNWIKSTGEVLHGPAYFPPLEAAGDMDAQMFGSSPSGGSDSMQLMFMMALAAARYSIDITSSYFVPDRLTVNALVAAARRGVAVRVLMPGRHTDVPLVQRASRACWGRLLKAGVSLHAYDATMMHAKRVVIDGVWTTLGSANFDNRSFHLNDEANLNVLSARLADIESLQFETDLARCRRIEWAEWRRRPWFQRAVDALARTLHAQL
jgi:cardiolipin synthase